MTEEELSSAHFCRAGGGSQRRLARDAAMNEVELNADCLHIAGQER